MNHGKRNLILLGIGALIITGASTTFSLWLYRSSGDIYLDRSRPGYLPDKEEAEEETSATNSSYTFSETGALNEAELDEYLKEFKVLKDRLQALPDPYGATPLSDESLGVPSSDESGK